MITLREPDAGAIAQFVDDLFRYADSDTFVSLRAFDQNRRDVPPVLIRAMRLNGAGHASLVAAATKAAGDAANRAAPAVFAPPICTFTNPDHARTIDLANGLTLSVEVDEGNTAAARAKLESLLGPATVIVASGGEWSDPETGEVFPKLHLHWRLSEPTREAEDHAKLRHARELAARLVGADPTGKPVVHPLRWPGSWNCKRTPVLARIVAHNPDAEVHLVEALDTLADATEATGLAQAGIGRDMGGGKRSDPQAPFALVADALAHVPNADVHYDDWVRMGYAVYAATGGSAEGFDLFCTWSAKSAKHDPDETAVTWRRVGASPPQKIGAGTIFFLAAAAGWKRPEREEPPPYDGCSDASDPGADDRAPVRPTIQVKPGQLDVLADAGELALLRAGAEVFQRADHLVRPGFSEVPAADGRTTIAAGLHALTTPALREELSRVADWQKFDGRSRSWQTIDPPGLVASVLDARKGRWRLRACTGIITCPTLRPDCTVLREPGYDAQTRLFHMPEPNLIVPAIHERPTRGDAEAALALLCALLTEFPFVTATDRAVALSLIVSTVTRGAVGMVPVHAFTAPSPGSGKSFLSDVTTAIVSGRLCPVITAGKTEEELEKRLGAMLLAGYQVISIDNISNGLSGDALCQIAERPTVRIRILGKSETPECEFRGIIIANGNNLVIVGDMTRRVLLGKLDAGVERPEERIFTFDPLQRVLADRGRYVAAAMTIVKSYVAAGMPGKLAPLASYSAWSDRVRSALVWLGCGDPVATMEETRDSDPVLTALRTTLQAWRDAFGDEEIHQSRDRSEVLWL